MTKMKRADEYNSFAEIVEELRNIAMAYREGEDLIMIAPKWKGLPLDVAISEIATAILWLEREKE